MPKHTPSKDTINKKSKGIQMINVGRIRRFSKGRNAFSEWEPLSLGSDCSQKDENGGFIIDLSKGGKLVYYPHIIKSKRRDAISKFMDGCNLFRQYKIRGFNEPRVHVLLSRTGGKSYD